MRKPRVMTMSCAVLALYAATAIAANAQTFTTLATFDVANGELPYAPLIQGLNGNFYGTTGYGGVNEAQCSDNECGTVFEITPAGQLTTLHTFCQQSLCTDGQIPAPGLVLATNGNFYGTTVLGGAVGYGTAFEITPGGQLTTLYSFCTLAGCADGENPDSALVQGPDGSLYGTTEYGGSSNANRGGGTVFQITPVGQLTTVYGFCQRLRCDGSYDASGLVVGTNGNFFGTTGSEGTRQSSGEVFEMTPAGELKVLHRFCSEPHCADGAAPFGTLVQGTDGNFYGTTYEGGANQTACYKGCGTIFKITPAGQFTKLYSFCSQTGCSDGEGPYGGLALAPDGNLYGTTQAGGTNSQCFPSGCGTIFQITPLGQLTTLYNFCSQPGCSDGEVPDAGLLLATNGKLYGTTLFGGTDTDCSSNENTGCGTVYSLSVGLEPFVKTLPGFGKVGEGIEILGNELTSVTSVAFGSISATFTIKSHTLILADVPSGATTGYLTVTTPSGTLTSNVPFRVLP